jgi:dihydrofolate reductase
MNSESTSPAQMTLVVAMANERVIGVSNQLPWHLPEDLQHFKRTTLNHCMIMGRKTFESIGKALPGRRSIVLTRQANWSHAGVETACDLAAALRLAKQQPQQTVFIVGGAQIYEQALPMASQIIATEIELAVKGDAFFPALDPKVWAAHTSTDAQSSSGLKYKITHYRRVNPLPI